MLNQIFLLRIDCKSAKYVIEKDVENIASKHIFARWQSILSVFDFDIEYIKDLKTPSLISLPVNFCSVTMTSRRSKDKTPATTNPIVKKEHVSSLDIVNRFTPLGTILKPNYSSILTSSYDPYALTIVN